MIWPEVILLIIGFLSGSIMYGTILAKLFYKKRIKEYGSKNPGATNMGRVLGKTAGFLTFILDGTKGTLVIGIALLLKKYVQEFENVYIYIGGLGAVLGHCFSPLEKFKGGKGVATSIGVLLFISPYFLPILAVTWVGSVFLTSYVSVGSILYAASSLIIGISIPSILQENYVYLDNNFLWTNTDYAITIGIVAIISLIIIIRHHANIKRLINNNEKKVNLINFLKKYRKIK